MTQFSIKAAWGWWALELSSLVPESMKYAFLGFPRAKMLVFSPDVETVEASKGKVLGPIKLLDLVNNADAALNQTKIRTVDVVWPESKCLIRNVLLPGASRSKFEKMLQLDLLQSTPFGVNDIYWSFEVGDALNGKTSVKQCVVKQENIRKLMACAPTYGLRIRKVYVSSSKPSNLVVDNSAQLAAPARFWRKANVLLMVAILGLSGALMYSPHIDRVRVLEQVDARILDLSKDALDLRNRLDASQTVEAEKAAFVQEIEARPRLSDSIAELTQQLPDNVWLQSLAFQSSSLTLSGTIDGAAANLVLDLGKSEGLENPRLSGTVSKTNDGNNERFEITVDVVEGRL